jgi:signal transduction histidine kinase
MAISYRIVQAHGGDIDVASRPGAGTAITVSLPRRAAAVAGSQLPVASRASL